MTATSAWEAIYRAGGQLNAWPYEHIVGWCLRNVAPLRAETDMHALDIGCGAGNHSLFLAGLGFRVLAFDSSPAVIDVAAGRARESGAEIDFRVADMADIVLPDSRFAVAVDRLGASHTTPAIVEGLYDRLWAALRPGGTVLADLFSAADGERRLGERQPDGSRDYLEICDTIGVDGLAMLDQVSALHDKGLIHHVTDAP